MPLFTYALNIECGQVGLIPLSFVFAWILNGVMQSLHPIEIQMQLKYKTLYAPRNQNSAPTYSFFCLQAPSILVHNVIVLAYVLLKIHVSLY